MITTRCPKCAVEYTYLSSTVSKPTQVIKCECDNKFTASEGVECHEQQQLKLLQTSLKPNGTPTEPRNDSQT